ncbi:hypothetical protein BH11MYX1_BH11MYX1_21260 [soil metagenome]
MYADRGLAVGDAPNLFHRRASCCGSGTTAASADATELGSNVVTLTIRMGGLSRGPTPDLVRYRDGAGPWLIPDEVAPLTYALHVTDGYQLVVACAKPAGGTDADVRFFGRTFADGDAFATGCGWVLGNTTAPVMVTGQMLQAGRLQMGRVEEGTTSPWSFELSIPPGTYDRVALTEDQRISIERGLVITGPTSLPNIDLSNAVPLSIASPTVTGELPDEIVTGLNMFRTAHGGMMFSNESRWSGSIATVPASLLAPGDRQLVTVRADNQVTRSIRSVQFPSETTEVALPPVLEGVLASVVDGDLGVGLGALPPYESIQAYVDSHVTSAVASFEASASFFELAGRHVVLDTHITGFEPGWRVDLAAERFAYVAARHVDGAVSTTTMARLN